MSLKCDCGLCCSECGPHDPGCISWELSGKSADDEPCSFMTWIGSMIDPPEYCDEDRKPGTEYCGAHQEE
jgi:hypothetical protein